MIRAKREIFFKHIHTDDKDLDQYEVKHICLRKNKFKHLKEMRKFVLRNIRAGRYIQTQNFYDLYSYKCKHCGSYHLTKMPSYYEENHRIVITGVEQEIAYLLRGKYGNSSK